MSEPQDARLRRLHMRSMRRGIREMDLILGDFSAHNLADLEPAQLDLYEAMLGESDHDLYQWISGQRPAPRHYLDLVTLIAGRVEAGFARGRGA